MGIVPATDSLEQSLRRGRRGPVRGEAARGPCSAGTAHMLFCPQLLCDVSSQMHERTQLPLLTLQNGLASARAISGRCAHGAASIAGLARYMLIRSSQICPRSQHWARISSKIRGVWSSRMLVGSAAAAVEVAVASAALRAA